MQSTRVRSTMMTLCSLILSIWSKIKVVAATVYALFQAKQTNNVSNAYQLERYGLELVLRNTRAANKFDRRRWFRASFGTDAANCLILWKLLHESGWLVGVSKPDVKHVLWALLLLKKDLPTHEQAVICKCDEDTFDEWSWFYLQGIASLASKVVKWEDRLSEALSDVWLATVNTLKFPVKWREDEVNEWCSLLETPDWQDIRGSVKYEVAISKTGYIVHWNGPFPEDKHDRQIFRSNLETRLSPNELVLGGMAYKREPRVISCRFDRVEDKAMERALVFEEVVRRHIMAFEMLRSEFKYNPKSHKIAFEAAVVVTQLNLKTDHRRFHH